jgi:hypothetical protein
MPTSGLHVAEFADQNSGAGFLDSVWDVGESLLAQGWAIDPSAKVPAEHVIFADGMRAVLESGRVNVERRDVAEAQGETCLRSGFRIRIRKDLIQDASTVNCYAYFPKEARAMRLEGAFVIE